MKSMTPSPDRIEVDLVDIESMIARLRAIQVDLLADIDRMQVPLADGCRTLPEWISGRLDVAPETARQLVRLLRSDRTKTNEAMANGTITFDRALELARLPKGAGLTVEESRRFDIPGLRRLVAHRRRVTHVDQHEAFERRHLVLQPNLDESTWRLWGSLPGYEGKIVDEVLANRADRFPALPHGVRLTRAQRHADALVALCADAATGAAQEPLSSTISIFVDAAAAAATQGETGAAIESGPPVGVRTLDRILCEGDVEVNAVNNGKPLGIGRKRAAIPPRLGPFILWRDGGCTADGCTSRHHLQVHHVVPHSKGGATEADNLTTLCWFHIK